MFITSVDSIPKMSSYSWRAYDTLYTKKKLYSDILHIDQNNGMEIY